MRLEGRRVKFETRVWYAELSQSADFKLFRELLMGRILLA